MVVLEVDELAVEAVEVVALARDRRALLCEQRGEVAIDLAVLQAEPGHPPGVLGSEAETPQRSRRGAGARGRPPRTRGSRWLPRGGGRTPADSYQRMADEAIPARSASSETFIALASPWRRRGWASSSREANRMGGPYTLKSLEGQE